MFLKDWYADDDEIRPQGLTKKVLIDESMLVTGEEISFYRGNGLIAAENEDIENGYTENVWK